MSDQTIYCGRGYDVPYADFMHLINLTFGFDTPESEFLPLLPKLYREWRRPQDSNYVVVEDGVPCAAVGAYDHELLVAGHRLKCRGVGNVAVHPDYRSRGYMKMTMNAALDGMVADGVVLSALGGRRQRYQYFSYDRAGTSHHFSFNRDNLHHGFGDMSAPFAVRSVTEEGDPALDFVKALSDASPVSPVRPREDLLDICLSWHHLLLVMTEGETYKGYCIITPGGHITEIRAAEEGDFLDLLRSILVYRNYEGIGVSIPPFDTAYLAAIERISEGENTGCSMMYTVLNYRAVTEAFFELRATYDHLPDGTLSLLIHGRGGEERICLSVRDGKPTVTPLPADAPVDLELSHLDAMNFLFAPFSPMRDRMDHPCRLWLPLPLWIYHADEV